MTALGLLVRAALLFGLVLLSLRALRTAPAVVRRAYLVAAFAFALAAPALAALLPAPSAGSALVLPQVFAPVAELGTHGASTAPVERRASWHAPAPRTVLTGLWLGLAALFALRALVAELRAQALVRRAAPHGPGVAVSGELDAPAVAGLFRPTILLPRSFAAWSDVHLRAVLAHERAHVAQRDGLVLLLARLTCALYWPVPFAWQLARRLRRACELAADERAVQSGLSPLSYADTLLAFARAARLAPHAATLSLVSELEERIAALCAPARAPWTRARRVFAFAPLLAVASLLGWTREAHSETPSPVVALDDSLQDFVEQEVRAVKGAHGADDVLVVVLDAATGRVVAETGPTRTARTPGSTLKPFLVALALDAGKVAPDAALDCDAPRSFGAREVHDAFPHGPLDLTGLLAQSSNVCATRVLDALGRSALLDGLSRLHLRDAPAELPANLDDDFTAATVAIGSGLRVTPLQLASAYLALVDGTFPGEGARVFDAQTARRVRTMLESVVYDPHGTGARAQVPGVRVAGKTGTAEEGALTYASFAGFAPAQAPRYVVLAGVTSRRPGATGGKLAAPLFARVAGRLTAP